MGALTRVLRGLAATLRGGDGDDDGLSAEARLDPESWTHGDAMQLMIAARLLHGDPPPDDPVPHRRRPR